MVVMITSEEYKELIIKANKYDELQKPKMCAAENKTEEIKSEGKHCKDEKDADITIEVGKLEGDKAKEFMNFIKRVTGEDKK